MYLKTLLLCEIEQGKKGRNKGNKKIKKLRKKGMNM
jgi:hypothetical protein